MTSQPSVPKNPTFMGFNKPLELNLELLIAVLFCLNAIDAIATISWVTLEIATEANPFMAELLSTDPLLFMVGKLGLVSLGSILFWRLQQSPLAALGCAGMVLVYSGICIYHVDKLLFAF